MILERNTWNNGYGCSCCRSDWNSSDWIEEGEITPLTEIIDYIYDENWKGNDNHLELLYEKDGKTLYGFHIDYYKAREDVYIMIGEEKYRVLLDYEPQIGGLTREQMMEKAKEVLG